MAEEMRKHGLDKPLISTNSGYLEITFSGPGDKLDRLCVPGDAIEAVIEPSEEAKLNDRQREMIGLLRQDKELTSRICEQHFGVSRDTTSRDFRALVELRLAARVGRGRATRYVLAAHG